MLALLDDPTLRQPLYFAAFNIAWTYILSEITNNVSQVDRIWTFVPTLTTAYYAFAPAFSWAPAEVRAYGVQPRAVLMFGLQSVWMCRLSYNTYRRGLFAMGDEDYRWVPLRKAMPGILFKIFNLGFVAITQNLVLLLMGMPARGAMMLQAPLGSSDSILGTLSLVILALEFTADNQQHAFQTFKYGGSAYTWPGARIQWTEADAARGFVTRGLWAWSRHPNFACEQTFWVIQTLIPILASPRLPPLDRSAVTPFWIPSLAPAFALLTLFFSSTVFTEKLSSKKYPAYTDYQRRVGMFVPVMTVLKGVYLSVIGQKAVIDASLWGGKVKRE